MIIYLEISMQGKEEFLTTFEGTLICSTLHENIQQWKLKETLILS